jgi:hypothetical protein
MGPPKLKVRHYLKYLVLAALVLLVVWSVSCVVRDRALDAGFVKISVGMSETEVIGILGRPWRVTDCTGIFAPYKRPDCAETYIYRSAWAPLNPYYPVVWFGKDKHVIDKAPFSSP